MFESLDSSQRTFCMAPAGNLRLLAPAGCGKTLCLLFRCKHLVEQAKTRPRFLVVTFTKAAKHELGDRLAEDPRFAGLSDAIEVTTLNSWGFRRIKSVAFSPKLITSKADKHFAMQNQLQPIWRRHEGVSAAIEKRSNTTPKKLMEVIDELKSLGFDHRRHSDYDAYAAYCQSLREQGLGWRLAAVRDNLARVGVMDAGGLTPEDLASAARDRHMYDAFFRFWCEATNHLIENATFTLEDQKYFAYLDERQKLEEEKFLTGAARYDHVLVDEFQDINPLDLALIKAIWARSRATLTIIGDDDQAIFEWRGATPEYILDPARFFGAEFGSHTLEVNYRSPANIVELSQRLIAHNQRRVDKQISAASSETAEITVAETSDVRAALEHVYGILEGLLETGTKRIALIGRKRSQIIPYQVFFASRNIPFCAAEDLQVFMGGAFDRLLRLLMIKGQADMRMMRTQIIDNVMELCNLVRRYPLSKKDREALRRHVQQSGASTLYEAVAALVKYRGPLKNANSEGMVSLEMASAIMSFLRASTVAEALIELSDNFEGLHIDLGKAEDDIFYTDPPFLQLAEYAADYGDDYQQFVEDIERAKDQLAHVPPFEEDGSGGEGEVWRRPVHLMTALRAKGKEFDSVVLLDVNDGIWPSRQAQTAQQFEAERRVFYVAFTRARSTILMLTRREIGDRPARVSPYLNEMGLVSE